MNAANQQAIAFDPSIAGSAVRWIEVDRELSRLPQAQLRGGLPRSRHRFERSQVMVSRTQCSESMLSGDGPGCTAGFASGSRISKRDPDPTLL
jgi:hypothetical protein